MSRDFFNKAALNTIDLKDEIQPPPYKYYKFIKTPKEMGMSTKGSMKDLEKNVSSLVSYGELLISGKGDAVTTNDVLGGKYFLKTGGQCRTSNGKVVDRFVYINNVPFGNVPLSTNAFIKFQEFKGLIPGMMESVNDIDTATLFQGFMGEANPECQQMTLETIDNDNKKGQETHYIANSDIKRMNPCNFKGKKNPITGAKCILPEINKTPIIDNILKRTTFGGGGNINDKSGAGGCQNCDDERKNQFLKAGANIANKANLGYLKSQISQQSGIDMKNLNTMFSTGLGMFKKTKTFAKNKNKLKNLGKFFGKSGFTNMDNETLCENLKNNPMARNYMVAFIIFLVYLLFKFMKK